MRLEQALINFDLAIAGEVAPRTRQWYTNKLRSLADHLGDVPLEEVDIHQLRQWRADLLGQQDRWADHPTLPTRNGGLSRHTVHGYIRAARRFFRWCVLEQLLETSPAARLHPPRLPDTEPKAISREDLDKILSAAEDSGPRDYALVRFLADTGCRLGGLAGLTIEDLDLKRNRAIVREKGKGGSGNVRAVYFGETTTAALETYIGERTTGPVWLGTRGPLTRGGIYQAIKRLAKRAGVDGRYNPHAFRHAWAKIALENGADLGTVSQVLGHSDIAVTHNSYGRWTDGELADRARQFSPLADTTTDF